MVCSGAMYSGVPSASVSETGEDGPASRRLDEDVVELDVSMEHARRMNEAQRVRDLGQDELRVCDRQVRLAFQQMREGLAFHERKPEQWWPVYVICQFLHKF